MKQKLLLCGAAVFAVLFLFSGIMLGRQLSDQKQSAEAFDNIADMIEDERSRMLLNSRKKRAKRKPRLP